MNVLPEEDLSSLRRQLAEARNNLRLIQERTAEFVVSVDIPLQLVKEERRLRAYITELERQLVMSGEQLELKVVQHNLPPRNLSYYERRLELEAALLALRRRYYILSIEGIGGSGKTALALEVAYQCLELGIFEKAIWCSDSLLSAFESITQVLDVDLDMGLSLDQQVFKVLQALEDRHSLLVFDGIDSWADAEKVRQFLLEIPAPNKVLVTSRFHQSVAQRVITLGGLPISEALQLLRFEAGRRGLETIAKASDNTLETIVEATGGLPLAILWVLGQAARIDLPRVIQSLQRAAGDIFPLIFAKTWEQLSPNAQEMLRWLPLLGDSFTKNEIAKLMDLKHDSLEVSLNELVEGTLVQVGSNRADSTSQYRLHTLTKAFASQELVSRLNLESSDIHHNFSLLREHLSIWQDAKQAAAPKEATITLEAIKKIAQHINGALASPLKATDILQLKQWTIAFLNTSSAFQDTRLPLILPLIFTEYAQVSSDDYLDLTNALLQTLGSVQVGLLVVLAERALAQQFSSEVCRKMKVSYACDIVSISREDYLSLVVGKQPRRTLRRLVLASIDLNTISPFTITGATPDNVFFGREQQLRELAERCGTISYIIVGGRRIGKTSLLDRLHRVRLPAAGFRAIYHDCSRTPTYDAFLTAAAHEWQPQSPHNPPSTLGDLLQNPSSDKPLVLLLDEADKLIPADRANNWQLSNTLRALANSGQAQTVLSGERTLRDALHDPKCPLFNFGNEMLLGPLDHLAVEELVTRPMKQLEIELVDEKAVVGRIWAFTSGHPNVVQRLCHRLIKRLNNEGTRRITLDDVNAIIEDPGFLRDDFLSTYWEAATSLEKIISLLMADDETVRTLHTVRQALAKRCDLHPKVRAVDDALQRLVDLRSILMRTPAGYEFAVSAFPDVVAGTMTLEDMLDILTEEYQENGE